MKVFYIFVIMLIHTTVLGGPCVEYESKIHMQSHIILGDYNNGKGFAMSWPWLFAGHPDGGMTVVNFSNPETPYIETTMEFPFTPNKFWHAGGILLVVGRTADGYCLATVDVVDPRQPTLLDTIPIPTWVYSVSIKNDRATVLYETGTILFVDLSNPNDMIVSAVWETGQQFYTIYEYAGWTYLGNRNELVVADLSDPLNPFIQSSIPCEALYTVGDAGFLTVTGDNSLAVFDVRNPDSPVQTFESSLLSFVRSMDMNDGKLFVEDDFGYKLFSISDVGGLVLESQIEYPLYDYGNIFLHAENAFICEGNGISSMALGDGQTVPLVTVGDQEVDPTPWEINDISVREDFSFVAAGIFGLLVFDFRTPTEPAVVGSGYTPGSMNHVVASDNYAILAGGTELNIFDITDPTLPLLVGNMTVSGESNISSLAVHGSTIWLGCGSDPLIAVDFSFPFAPEEYLSLPQESSIVCLDIDDDLLHITNQSGFYEIYSLETLPPLRLSALDLSAPAVSFKVQGDLVFFCQRSYGYSLVDFSDPMAPEILYTGALENWTENVELNGPQAIVSEYGQVHLLDISDLRAPIYAGTIWGDSDSVTLLPGGEVLLMGGYDFDFKIAPASCQVTPVWDLIPLVTKPTLTVWPNPFNPTTTITFSLPHSSPVALQVYDPAGRLVKTLVSSEFFDSGEHSWTWDGRDVGGRSVASGVYFVRMEAGTFNATGRMALIR